VAIDTQEYREAAAFIGPLAAQWADKPHCLVYDLCGAIDAILAAYIRESPRPDVHPDYRWRAVMPSGFTRHFASREAAITAIKAEITHLERET
jgi:hypothetical protein